MNKMGTARLLYGSEHRQIKRKILALSFLDLVFITCTIAFFIVQLISVGFIQSSAKVRNNETTNANTVIINGTEVALSLTTLEQQDESDGDKEKSAQGPEILDNCNNGTLIHRGLEGGCEPKDDNDNETEFKSVIGARIYLSIQLIIYSSQLAFGVLLFIASYHNDSRNLHLWVLFSEVMVVVICLNLFINFFGKFHWITAILTALYILYKVILIRLVRRFIQVNDLALTQFGSVAEFEQQF